MSLSLRRASNRKVDIDRTITSNSSPFVQLGLKMGRAKPALGRAGPGYWAGWVMKNVEP
jgi:hypothetical protein